MAAGHRDENMVVVLMGVSSVDHVTPIEVYVDPTTHRVLVDLSGRGITLLPATGSIDDSNVNFTFTSQPTVLVINGATYQQTGGTITWTWLAGTATLSSPVGTGGSIFGMM